MSQTSCKKVGPEELDWNKLVPMKATDGTLFRVPIDFFAEVFDNALHEDELAKLLAGVPEMQRKSPTEFHWFSLY